MNKKLTRLTLIAALLIGMLLLAPLPAAAGDAPAHSMDDALLLMFASQSRLYDDYLPAASIRLPGLASPLQSIPQQGASPAEINEQRQLANAYNQLANSLTSNDTVRQHLEDRASLHSEQAEDLAQARRRFLRNRHNIFRQARQAVARPIARVGQGIARGGRWFFRGVGRVGRVVITIAKDEVIFRAKQIVRAKIQDLVDIGRGRIDAVMQRIAARWGLPAAELLRAFVVDPAFNRLRAQINRQVDRLVGENGDQETSDQETSGEENADEEEYNPDWANVNEEGDTDYDDPDEVTADSSSDDAESETNDEEEEEDTSPADIDPEQVFDVHGWFSDSSCNRFNGQMPAWMDSTEKHASPWMEMQWLSCHWNSDLRESGYGCDADGEHCPLLPGRAEVDIYAHPTIADAQTAFRSYTTDCSQDATCVTGLTELVWYYSEAEYAYADRIAHYTRIVALNDNVIIELWWGGAEHESDIYGLLSTADALIDPLQR